MMCTPTLRFLKLCVRMLIEVVDYSVGSEGVYYAN